jgi:uncharacterized protein YcbX
VRRLRSSGVSGPSWTRSFQLQREAAETASYLSDEEEESVDVRSRQHIRTEKHASTRPAAKVKFAKAGSTVSMPASKTRPQSHGHAPTVPIRPTNRTKSAKRIHVRAGRAAANSPPSNMPTTIATAATNGDIDDEFEAELAALRAQYQESQKRCAVVSG